MSIFDHMKEAVDRHIADKESLFGDIGTAESSLDVQSNSREASYKRSIDSRMHRSVIPATNSASHAFTAASNDLQADSQKFLQEMTDIWTDASSGVADSITGAEQDDDRSMGY